jgi:hypothetical protein
VDNINTQFIKTVYFESNLIHLQQCFARYVVILQAWAILNKLACAKVRKQSIAFIRDEAVHVVSAR